MKTSPDPKFCLTSDLDWAPEWAIDCLWQATRRLDIPVTPFITHRSELVARGYDRDGYRHRVGLHPNFLPGSTHGAQIDDVIGYVTGLWPQARCFRSHSFVDSTPIAMAMVSFGLLYDSNLCLFLQDGIAPLRHCSGLWRFPVFWEDDIHYKRGLPCRIDTLLSSLHTPGLKILNVHPFLYALNVPDEAYYHQVKHLNREADRSVAMLSVFDGDGIRTLVDAILSETSGYEWVYLDDLYEAHIAGL